VDAPGCPGPPSEPLLDAEFNATEVLSVTEAFAAKAIAAHPSVRERYLHIAICLDLAYVSYFLRLLLTALGLWAGRVTVEIKDTSHGSPSETNDAERQQPGEQGRQEPAT
jgi:hypothetical protein